MAREHHLPGRLVLVFMLLLVSGAAGAQELYNFTVGALGGIGGSVDVEPGDGFGNTGGQVNLTMVTEPHTHVGFRIGRLTLDDEESFGTLSEAELTYITLAGEYRFQERYYESGVYLGLGGYRLDGQRFGEDEQDTSLGAVLGFTGEFKVNRWFGVVIELSGHYVDFDEAQVFGMAHGGLAVHF
ncbi:MAG TPA: hypothetical protein VMW27_16655 [Thermoanaerobaculia bacterium]|nr:hypothetical protein [Thermoanaerobaculia bacterium]